MGISESVRRSGPRAGTRSLAVVAALATVLGAVGCSSSSKGSAGGSGSNGGSKALNIGLVGFDATTVAAQREADAAKSAMQKAGWNVASQDPAGDASKANGICQQYVAQHKDAIVVDVFQGPQMAQCLSSAKGANIPVFFIASVLADGMAGAISTSVVTQVNELFTASLKGKPEPKIFTLQYSPGAPCLARQKEMDKDLSAAGIPSSAIQRHEVKIPGQVPDSQAATTAWLNAHPASSSQTQVIWSCFSDAALGALAALHQAGRSVPIYTWDLTKQIVPLLKDGSIVATSISDAGKLGTQLVDMINAYRGGDKTPKQVEAPALVLDKTNIDQYVASNPVS